MQTPFTQNMSTSVTPSVDDPSEQNTLDEQQQDEPLSLGSPNNPNVEYLGEPSNIELLLRHRSPPNGATTSPPASLDFSQQEHSMQGHQQSKQPSKYRHDMDRILADSAVHIRHPLPDLNGDSDDDGDITEPGSLWSWWYGWKRTLFSSHKDSPLWFLVQYHNYTWATLGKDCVAGATVAILAIPLSMSYSKLAGLPAYYGLYATFVPPLVYPWLGTCRQLAVGPAALVSLLIGSGLDAIVRKELSESSPGEQVPISTDSEVYISRYTQLAIQCAFLAGLIQIGMGIFRMGFVTQFLSRAVISGFTSGAVINISLSQFKHFLGYDIPTSKRSYELIVDLVRGLDQLNWKSLTMGLSCLLTLLVLKNMSQNKRLRLSYPNVKWLRALGPFLVTVISISLTLIFNLEDEIIVVGKIPSGLPEVTLNQWMPLSSEIGSIVISMVIVSFVQSIAISKRFAYKHGYEIDSSQELISLGMANLIGSVFQASPTTGAIGQSAVNDEIGAVTGVASFVTGLLVMVVLLFLTSVFEKMPLCVLAAIVLAFVTGMFDYNEAKYLYNIHKFDFSVWVVAFVGVIVLGVENGLIVSVTLSLLIVLYESAYPHTAVLGRLPGTSLYRNIKQYSTAERYDGLVIVRIDAPLYFANAQNARDKVRKYKRAAEDDLMRRHTETKVRYIIIDLSPVSHVDTTALHVLQDMYQTQKKLGVQLCFCNPNITVTLRLLKSGLIDMVGRDHFFSDVIDAVQWCLNEMDNYPSCRRLDNIESVPNGEACV